MTSANATDTRFAPQTALASPDCGTRQLERVEPPSIASSRRRSLGCEFTVEMRGGHAAIDEEVTACMCGWQCRGTEDEVIDQVQGTVSRCTAWPPPARRSWHSRSTSPRESPAMIDEPVVELAPPLTDVA